MAERNGSWRFDVAAMMDMLKTEGPDYYVVWTLLLSDARREPGKVKTAAGTVEMNRGDVLISYRGLAARLGDEEGKKDAVRRIVKKMCATDATQMRHQVRHHFSVLSINNYEAWAGEGNEVAPPFAPQVRHRCDGSRESINSLEEASSKEAPIAIEPTEPPFDAEKAFEEVWSAYPRKLGRQGALKHFRATVKKAEDVPRVLEALRRFKEELRVNQTLPKYIPHGDTWFNKWRDWEVYEPPMLLVKTPTTPAYDWENDPRLHQWDDDQEAS